MKQSGITFLININLPVTAPSYVMLTKMQLYQTAEYIGKKNGPGRNTKGQRFCHMVQPRNYRGTSVRQNYRQKLLLLMISLKFKGAFRKG